MSIYQTAVRKPITTILIFVALAILGLFSLRSLPIDLYPNIESNTIIVFTSYSGVGPEDIETNLTKPLQNSLNSISNLKHIRSESREGVSVINLEFEEGIDIVDATNDVRDKLSAISQMLPDDASDPLIFKFSMDDLPVMLLTVKANESTRALNKILNEGVVNPLGRIEGVGSVSLQGTETRQIQVYCDPYRLEAYGIPISTISNILRAENSDTPIGSMDMGSTTQSLRVVGTFSSPEELENVVIGSFMGKQVYLKDVARVEDTTSEKTLYSYTNNERGAVIIVTKQAGSNSVQIANKIESALPEIAKGLPKDVQITPIWNTADNIRQSINSLFSTIGVTFLVVMLVVLFFLGRWRATFIIVLTIPISLVGSFIYLKLTGNTINIISLSSLSIAIGMVVDDAIVVLENITTHIEKGSYPKQAAVHATNEVAISVIASTLTMLAVFLPLTMIGGMTGIMFRQLGWIVSIVMIVSTISALTLTPTLSAYMLRHSSQRKPSSWGARLMRRIDGFLAKIEGFYRRTLEIALAHKRWVVVIALGIFVFSMMLFPLIKTEFMPQVDNSQVSGKVKFPVGTSVEEPLRTAQELTATWQKKYPEIKSIHFSVGESDASNAFLAMSSTGEHVVSFHISFVDPKDRKKDIFELTHEMQADLDAIPGIKEHTLTPGGDGMGGQPSVDVDIYGHDFETTTQVAQEFERLMADRPSIASTKSNREEYLPEYKIVFDREKIARSGLSVATAAMHLRNAMYGALATYYREDGDEYEVRVRIAPEYRHSFADLERIWITSPTGQKIRLSEIASIQEHYSPPSIVQKDRERVVTISCYARPRVALSDLAQDADAVMKQIALPQGVSYKLSGTYETQQKSFADMQTLLLLIIMLVFIVMAAEFESLAAPFVIMFSVPFSFSGVFFGLALTRTPMSIIALIGAIMLVGIVVKNGIVLIDYTRLCRERGMGIVASCIEASTSRLRPVLMTTLTTVLGMIPMAIGIGEGSEMWQPMGMTVAFGLTFSTMVTLILIPTIYAMVSAISLKRKRRKDLRRITASKKAVLKTDN